MKNKRSVLIAVLVTLLILASGCSRGDYKSAESTVDHGASSYTNYDYDETIEEEADMENYIDQTGDEAAMEMPSDAEVSNRDIALGDRKIIKVGSIRMETLTFDETIEEVKSLISQYMGYTSYSSVQGGRIQEDGNTRYASYTIKVPAEHFEILFEALKQGSGNVLYADDSIEDVTNSITDIDARLKTLGIQEERMLDTLSRLENLEDIVELEFALQDVRYNIERYSATLRDLENQVKYSTINLNIQEVYEETLIVRQPLTLGERIQNGLDDTFREIKTGAEDLLVFVIVEFPYILFTLIVTLAVVIILRKTYKKNKDKITKAEKSNIE